MNTSLLVAGHVDHAGQLLRPTLARVDVVPQVLIDPQRGHPGERASSSAAAVRMG